MNQTLVRSANTSLIALLPVGSILFVGAGLLGAGTLKDLSLSLFIGLAVGTYSSIYQAAPILIWLKVGSHSFVPTDDASAGSKAERIDENFGAKP